MADLFQFVWVSQFFKKQVKAVCSVSMAPINQFLGSVNGEMRQALPSSGSKVAPMCPVND
jgi:hypothetical protein